VPGKNKDIFPSYSVLEKNLKNGVLETFYFFVGPERFLKNEIISRIRKQLNITPHGINDIVLYHDSPNIADVFGELETQSFFSEHKLVVIKNADKLSASMLGKLKEILQRETLEAYVIFVSENPPFRPQTKNIEKILGRTYSFVIDKKELRSYLKQFLKKFQKRMSTQAEETFLEMYTSLYDIHNNLEKLSLAVEDREIIEEKDLDICTSFSHDTNIFLLTDSIRGRNVPDAFRCIEELMLVDKDTAKLIGFIRTDMIKTLRAKLLLEKNEPAADICEEMRIPYFKRDLFLKQTKSLTVKKICQQVSSLSRFDYLSKTSSLSPEHLMQMLIVELCG
jgi:DNA polymerase III subunit delta